MTDDHITTREFDGYTKAMRAQFDKVSEQVTQVLTLLDTLLKGRVEEARTMGEITESIRSINLRLEKQELETAKLRFAQETEVKDLRTEINGLWDKGSAKAEGHIKWWGQVLIAFITVAITIAATKLAK